MKSVCKNCWLLFALVTLSFADDQAHGDLIVEVQNTVITAGGTGTVEVLISSTLLDVVDGFRYKFQIADQLGTSLGNLRFSDPQLMEEVSDTNYIHASNSGGAFSTASNAPDFDELRGGDFTNDFLGNAVGTSPKLLVRMDIEHEVSGLANSAVGDQFRIELIQDGDTFFNNILLSNLSIESASAGLVTFSPAAVPEPTAVAILSLGGLMLLARRRRFSASF